MSGASSAKRSGASSDAEGPFASEDANSTPARSYEDPRRLLRRYGLRPKKGLGQNFMVDPAAIERVAQAAELTAQDLVLEIGPGLGTLTRRLLELVGRVVAVEIDPQMVRIVGEQLGANPRLRLVAGDILKVDPATLFDAPYKVVANVPYYITSAILRHLLEATVRPTLLVLTMQKEVARRIVSTGRRSLLAVSVQFYGRPRIAGYLPAGAFYPPPKVESAILCVDVAPQPAVDVPNVEAFFRIVKAGFSAPRKQLRNALANGLHRKAEEMDALLARAGVEASRRAETLSLEEWAAVAGAQKP